MECEKFKRKRVIVVGSGQSGLENAALMSEAGIVVHLVHRSPIDWLSDPSEKTLWEKIRYPRAPISDGWDNWIQGHAPYLFQKMPRMLKDNYLSGKGLNGPAGSHWLIPRLTNVTMHGGQKVELVKQSERRIHVTLSNGTTISA